jgi:hypothetical protein
MVIHPECPDDWESNDEDSPPPSTFCGLQKKIQGGKQSRSSTDKATGGRPRSAVVGWFVWLYWSLVRRLVTRLVWPQQNRREVLAKLFRSSPKILQPQNLSPATPKELLRSFLFRLNDLPYFCTVSLVEILISNNRMCHFSPSPIAVERHLEFAFKTSTSPTTLSQAFKWRILADRAFCSTGSSPHPKTWTPLVVDRPVAATTVSFDARSSLSPD